MSAQTVEAGYRLAYPPPEAARMCGISVTKLNEYRHRGWVQRIKLDPGVRNSQTLYTHEALVALLARLQAESEAAS